ncbi:DUF1828 domain-containing protein [Pseudomonas aeruginosa]|uniref:DUF1828 domain-containing protein n=1 Tax=Pseudomonas aeruginosa TaxID=287 RepID=UPI000FC4245E|nr:DUF1828 domain-containing protein [Pseudomonas aeruginosa]MBH8871471.1 DUF1828 domain-containing protein [Pseudomonas aeruginosa]RUB40759.1 DUF1828 domain-containing protein [Pseudomonas aeruginosa]WCV78735.1 DUF1828 domain-containing protein [Pseudomonas aeruginosa]HBO5216176.1 DUF1828 domain-containing protein [Pseudomonas aeruginosa]HBO5500539.1 DUF1828 domain-containing protein [Pseudomonas aeruginosa]
MNCTLIGAQLGFKCKPVADGLFYLESPLTLPFDGNLIGAYIQDLGNGHVRISDNADTLFVAMTHGVKPTAEKGRKLADLVASSGLELSDSGEIFKACPEDQLGFYLARFIEAAEHVGFACNKMRPSPVSRFDQVVGNALKAAFPKALKTDFKIIGASGHQLTLPFAIESSGGQPTLIQTVSTKDGKIDWSLVYRAVGKMLDIKNAHGGSLRRVILEPGDEEDNRKAATALADAASVIIYTGPKHLTAALAA